MNNAPHHGPPQRPRRIGLYGGSFDPVHLGHLLVACAALEELGLDRLSFVPAARSPFKPDAVPAPADVRLRMLRAALAGRADCAVDDSEIRRGGVSYSIDTVRAYTARRPSAELFWLIGADHVATLPQWREADALARAVTFVVIPRPGATPPEPPPPWRLVHLRGWPLAVSSSDIRGRIRLGLPVGHLVPGTVAEILAETALYRHG